MSTESIQPKAIHFELPDFSAFEAAAQCGNLLTLSVVIPYDHETPIALANRFIDEPCFFLLESATSGPGQIARYSFLGFDPLAEWCILDSDKGDALASLKAFLDQYKLAIVNKAPLKSGASGRRTPSIGIGVEIEKMGGAIGWLGYDISRTLEPTVGLAPPKKIGIPDAYMFIPKFFMALDQLTRSLTVVHYVLADGAVDLSTLYSKACEDLRGVVAQTFGQHEIKPVSIENTAIDFEKFEATFSRNDFMKATSRCLEEIRAGEIFQIQIGNRLSIDTAARPFDIFRHLRMLNPSPYMFYYKLREHIIMGASPEMMVGVTGPRVVHRPIAGTRRRTWSDSEDFLMRKELVESEKERAEHVMLVDLARNDIGRISKPGSVKVEELMQVEEYSHVFHMVSQVTGERRAEVTSFDVMRASFPNGTVTGAPKIRAMQLINSMEPCSREFYAGSLGIFDFEGGLKSTLLIRSMHYSKGRVSTQASAGIVFDSIPEQEWLETRNKMAACLTAMQNTR